MEHAVEGNVVMPGAGLVALTLLQTGKRCLRDVRFERFLPLFSKGRATKIVANMSAGRWQWKLGVGTVFSCEVPDEGLRAPAPTPPDGFWEEERAPVDVAQLYRAVNSMSGLQLAGTFQSVAAARLGARTAHATVSAAGELGNEATLTVLLDGALQSLAFHAGLDSRPLAPVSIGEVRIDQSIFGKSASSDAFASP